MPPTRAVGVALVAAGVLVLPLAAGGQQDADVVVEAARQVSTDADPARLYVSPPVAVHPDDPDAVVVGLADARNGGCGLAVSRDGGMSWSRTVETFMPDAWPHCVQRNFGQAMELAFASDGTLYVALSGSSTETEEPHPNGPIIALLGKTSDLGATHETLVVAEPGDWQYEDQVGFGQHRIPTVAVDPNDPDIVYRGWREWRGGLEDVPFSQRQQGGQLAVSTDGGQTWSEPVEPFVDFEHGYPEGHDWLETDTVDLAVASDGTAYGFSKERPPRGEGLPTRLLMVTSSDRGQTWIPSAIYEGESLDNPVVAIDHSDDVLYLAWAERVEGSDAPLDVRFMSSSDGGETWTEPVTVSDEPAADGISQYFPGISVAPDGRIDIAWHDFRDDPFFTPGEIGGMGSAEGQRWGDIYYSYSTDGGTTWAPNVRLTDRSIDREVGVTFGNQDVRGPVGTASTDAAAMVAWPDSRSSGEFDIEDAYFTRVRHTAAPVVTTPDEGTSAAVWAVLGAGAALAVGGIVLLAGARRTRRRPAPSG